MPQQRRGAALGLPVPVLALVLQRLPNSDRLRAARVARDWREAALDICSWDLALKLTVATAQQQLERLVERWAPCNLTALTLTSTYSSWGPGLPELPIASLFSFAPLGQLPALASLTVSLGLPHEFASLSGCTRLTRLCVDVPALSQHEYARHTPGWAHPGLGDVTHAVKRTAAHMLALTASASLVCVLSLTGLRDLDVSQAVAARGHMDQAGVTLPLKSTLPWLEQLTQLTRLKAHAVCMTEGVWALPALRRLHVVGEWMEQLGDAVSSSSTVSTDTLGLLGAGLTQLTLENCTLSGEGSAVPGALRALHLQSCLLPLRLAGALSGMSTLALTKDDYTMVSGRV